MTRSALRSPTRPPSPKIVEKAEDVAVDQKSGSTLNLALAASFNALAHHVTVWSNAVEQLFANEPSLALLSGHDVTLGKGMPLRVFLSRLSSSGLIVLTTTQDAWIDVELAAHHDNPTSEYTLSDGSIHRIEHTRLPQQIRR